jgi:hypothetical protein
MEIILKHDYNHAWKLVTLYRASARMSRVIVEVLDALDPEQLYPHENAAYGRYLRGCSVRVG